MDDDHAVGGEVADEDPGDAEGRSTRAASSTTDRVPWQARAIEWNVTDGALKTAKVTGAP